MNSKNPEKLNKIKYQIREKVKKKLIRVNIVVRKTKQCLQLKDKGRVTTGKNKTRKVNKIKSRFKIIKKQKVQSKK